MIAAANGIEPLLGVLEGVKSAGQDKWQACCPAHDDSTASLSITREGDKTLVYCHAGCPTADVVKACGLTMADLGPRNSNGSAPHVDKVYDYRNGDGSLEFQVVRMLPKDFRQRRNANDWKVKGCKVIPYRLPELLRADPAAPVFVVEGEKDCDNLAKLGIVATCNAGGAGKGKWKREHSEFLKGRHVVILPDNDDAGRDHANGVAGSLAGIARSVKIVELPDLPPKGDVSDWLRNGGTGAELTQLIGQAPEFDPDALTIPLDSGDLRGYVSVSAYKSFPIHTLPGVVGEFVGASATAIGCDPSLVALPLLCCLARAVGSTRTIQVKQGWQEPAVIWGAVVAPSGSHKTPAIQQAIKFLEKPQAKRIAEHAEELQQYAIDKALYERNQAEWKKGRTNDPPPEEPQEPACTRYITADATVEALVGILAKQFDGILVHRDELSGWLNGMDQYKGGKGSDIGHWLSMWSASSITVDRKSGVVKLIHVPRAAVSLLGGIQPGILKGAIGREHLQDGLCARLLLTMPEPKPVVWTEEVVDWALESRMTKVFDALLSLEPGQDEDGNYVPAALPMTSEAKARWVEYFNAHRSEAVGLDDDLRAAASKLEAYALRLSLIIHLCSWAIGEALRDEVDESSIAAGIELSQWFEHEAKRVYWLFGESSKDEETREIVTIIRRKGGSISARDLMRASRRYSTATEAEAALDSLRKAGCGKWVAVPPGPSGGKPTRVFQLTTSADADIT